MRKLSVAILFLVTLTACALLQAQTMPSGGASSGTSGQSASPGTTGQPAAPGQAQGAPGEMSPNAVQGCLSGASPNFTLTDTAGTVYRLQFPANANTSPLDQHVGESVQVDGTVTKGGASQTAAAGQPSIQVSRVGRGTGTCSGAAGAGGAKPPAK